MESRIAKIESTLSSIATQDEQILKMCESLDTTCKALNTSVQTLNTFMATSAVKEKQNEQFKKEVITKLSKLEKDSTDMHILKTEHINLAEDVIALKADVEALLQDEKDKVKVWKKNTFALGLLIFGTLVSLLFKGEPK